MELRCKASGYIFQTNELQDIIGAPASWWMKSVPACLKRRWVLLLKVESSIAVAGNIKYEFDSKEECEKVVRVFPKRWWKLPQNNHKSGGGGRKRRGIWNFGWWLEAKLRAQRNRPMRSLTMGLMGIQREQSHWIALLELK